MRIWQSTPALQSHKQNKNCNKFGPVHNEHGDNISQNKHIWLFLNKELQSDDKPELSS